MQGGMEVEVGKYYGMGYRLSLGCLPGGSGAVLPSRRWRDGRLSWTLSDGGSQP